YGRAASIDVPPSNMSALLGSRAEFYCGVTGQGGSESLLWRKLPSFFISQDDMSVNTSKYQITDNYRLHILDLIPQDDGEYQCQIMADMFTAWLVVCDVPTSVEISWNEENRDIGRYGNLTCTCPRSKPPASLRWFKESEEITDDAIPYEQEQDSNGYGESISYLAVTITEENFDIPYRCQADVPAVENAISDEFRFSYGVRLQIINSLLLGLVLFHFI
ncbi:hypothetical protein LSH36_62g05000, partial [Paralvinella palmiformis]